VCVAQVLQKAVCPEKRLGMDNAVSAIASVTDVAVSGDLQVAKVYVSILSDEQGRIGAMEELNKLEGYELMF
jgi:ribosome-binding factor A